MGEPINEILMRAAEGLRWLGKYTESNMLILFVRLVNARRITDFEHLLMWVEAEEQEADRLEVDRES